METNICSTTQACKAAAGEGTATRLRRRAGHDVLSGGEGADRAVHAGLDHVVEGGSSGDGEPGWSIVVDGDGAFVSRVQADLVAQRGTASGTALLVAIDAAFRSSRRDGRFGPLHRGASDGNRITVVETDDEQGYNISHSDRFAPGPDGTDSTVRFNPGYHVRHLAAGGRITASGPPLVVLFHEPVHGWNFQTATAAPGSHDGPGPDGPREGEDGVPDLERQAVGLPIDHDDDRRTPDAVAPGHPTSFTENALRAELGLALRGACRAVTPGPATGPPRSPATAPAEAGPGPRRRGRPRRRVGTD